MPRPPRFDVPDVSQHITQRGNNRIATFLCDADRAFYKRCLFEHSREENCDIHAYVLMGNHVHLLVTPHKPGAISRLMQGIGRRYVVYFNRSHERTGTLWEGRFKASVIDSAEYAINCHRYIDLNPVRAGLVVDPAQYRWSSFGRNAHGVPDALLKDHPVYESLGEDAAKRTAAYRAIALAPMDSDTLEKIRKGDRYKKRGQIPFG